MTTARTHLVDRGAEVAAPAAAEAVQHVQARHVVGSDQRDADARGERAESRVLQAQPVRARGTRCETPNVNTSVSLARRHLVQRLLLLRRGR